jgi:flagellin
MSSVSLSFGLRSSVNSLTDIGKQIDTANTRLSTGKKVNTALDNAGSYFAAVGFNKEATDLKNILDGQNNALSTISSATSAITGLSSLVSSVQALARQARNLASSDTTRDTLGAQIQNLLNQVDNVARDATFNGKNLLKAGSQAAADVLTVAFDTSTVATTTTRVTLTGADVGAGSATGLNLSIAANGLSYTAPATAGNTVTDGTDGTKYVVGQFTAAAGVGDGRLDALITAAGTALTKLNAVGSVISTNASVVQINQTFTTARARIASSAADSLTLADLNEEGAALTSLQTRQSFAVTSLQLAGQADKAILRLFG